MVVDIKAAAVVITVQRHEWISSMYTTYEKHTVLRLVDIDTHTLQK